MAVKKTLYAYSINGESYYGSYASRKAAIKAAMKERLKDTERCQAVWTAEIEDPCLGDTSYYAAEAVDGIVENMEEYLDDTVGEYAECFGVTDDEKADLTKRITAAIDEWIKERGIRPGCFTVSDEEEYVIKEEL